MFLSFGSAGVALCRSLISSTALNFASFAGSLGTFDLEDLDVDDDDDDGGGPSDGFVIEGKFRARTALAAST